jgi:hypothetical protein
MYLQAEGIIFVHCTLLNNSDTSSPPKLINILTQIFNYKVQFYDIALIFLPLSFVNTVKSSKSTVQLHCTATTKMRTIERIRRLSN